MHVPQGHELKIGVLSLACMLYLWSQGAACASQDQSNVRADRNHCAVCLVQPCPADV